MSDNEDNILSYLVESTTRIKPKILPIKNNKVTYDTYESKNNEYNPPKINKSSKKKIIPIASTNQCLYIDD